MNPFSLNKKHLLKKSNLNLVKSVEIKEANIIDSPKVIEKKTVLVKKGCDNGVISKLNKDDINFTGRIVMCFFTISEPGFLQYLLYKYDNKDELIWLFHDSNDDKIISFANEYLDTNFSDNVEIKGYLPIGLNDKIVYLFCYISHENIYNYTGKNLKWCCVDEIVNNGELESYKISSTVRNVFFKNIEMSYVIKNFDSRNEIPIVMYSVVNKEKMDYVKTLGLQFTYSEQYGIIVSEMISFKDAKERIKNDETLVMIRFAVFLRKKLSVIYPREVYDIKRQLEYNNYDSVYIGKINEEEKIKYLIRYNDDAIPLL